MTKQDIEDAKEAASHFLRCAARIKITKAVWLEEPTKETAALRWASMDLTRALAEMRKPG